MGAFDNICQLAGVRYHKALHNSDLVDVSFLRKARDEGVRLPTAGATDRDYFWGAYVFPPQAGLHGPVGYLDLASLYPNLIIMLNASPDTVIGDQDAFEASEYDESEVVWAPIDYRPVKRVPRDSETPWQTYTDPDQYKMVMEERNKNDWTKRWEDPDGPQTQRLYFIAPHVKEGFITDAVRDWIAEKYEYEGGMYAAIKQIVNCFTPDTDVLTPDGVVNICELSVGDEVYSYDPETDTMEVKPVTRTYAYPEYDGEIITYDNQNVDLGVTPNHDMIVENVNPHSPNTGYERIEAGNLQQGSAYELPHDWDVDGTTVSEVDLADHLNSYEVFVEPSVHGHTFASELGWYPKRRQHEDSSGGYVLSDDEYEQHRDTIDELAAEMWVHSEPSQSWVPKTYDGDDVIELLAWYVTEGSTYNSETKECDMTTRGETYTVTLSQHDTGNGDYEAIRALLERMGLTYHDGEEHVTVASEAWYRVLREWCGTDSHTKQLPEWVFDLSSAQTDQLFTTLMAGDGDTRAASHRYTTASETLRDDMLRLCLRRGVTADYDRDGDVWRVYTNPSQNSLRPARDATTTTPSDGVYCVEVADNHTVVAGRNGTFNVTGQSTYGYLGFTNSRLFDWRLAEAITLAGREVIKYTAWEAQSYIHDTYDTDTSVKMGDTDGCGIVLEDVADTDWAREVYEDTAAHVNDAYDSFCRETFGVRDHTMDVEVESVASRVFVPASSPSDPDSDGVKKRYGQHIVWDEGEDVNEITVTGLEATRSDTAPITETLQMAVMETLLREGTLTDDLRERIRDAYTAACNGETPLDELAPRKGLSSPPTAYGSDSRVADDVARGAKYANTHIDGVHVGAGDKPALVYPERMGALPATYTAETNEDGRAVDVVSLTDVSALPSDVTVDWREHADKTIRDPLQPIIETVGHEWDALVADQRQTGLTDY